MPEYIRSKITSTGTIHLRADNILVFKPNKQLKTSSLDELKENMTVYRSFSEGKKLPLLLDVEELQKIGAEEKVYIKNTMTEVFGCVAIVTTSPLSSFIVNIFMYLNRPAIPVRMCSNEEQALRWIEKVRKM